MGKVKFRYNEEFDKLLKSTQTGTYNQEFQPQVQDIHDTYFGGDNIDRIPGISNEDYLNPDDNPYNYMGGKYFDPTQEDPFNELRSERQGSVVTAATGVGRVASKVLREVLKTAGMAVGTVAGTTGQLADLASGEDRTDFLDTAFNNAFVKSVDENFDKLNKAALPVYVSEAVQSGNFMAKISSPEFWATEGADGIGYMLAAMAPGAALKGLKLGEGLFTAGTKFGSKVAGLGEFGTNVEKARRAMNLSIDKIDDIVVPAVNTYFEAGTEAAGVLNGVEEKRNTVVPQNALKYSKAAQEDFKLNPQKYFDQYSRSHGGVQNISVDQINQMINEDATAKANKDFDNQKAIAGRNTFLSNLAILAVPNYIQSKLVFGKNEAKALSNSIKPASLLERKAGAFLESATGESFEEVAQSTVENRNKQKALEGKLKDSYLLDKDNLDFFKDFANTLGTTEGQVAGFLGGFLGAGTAIVTGNKQAKKDIARENYWRGRINNAGEGLKDIHLPVFETEEYVDNQTGETKTRRVLDENNNPIPVPENIAKVGKAMSNYKALNDAYDDAVKSGDMEKLETVKKIAETGLITEFVDGSDMSLDAFKEHLNTVMPTDREMTGDPAKDADIKKSNIENKKKVEQLLVKATFLNKEIRSFKDMSSTMMKLEHPETKDGQANRFLDTKASEFIAKRAEEHDLKTELAKKESLRSDLESQITVHEVANPLYVEGVSHELDKTLKTRVKSPAIEQLDKDIVELKDRKKTLEKEINENLWDNEQLNKDFLKFQKKEDNFAEQVSPEKTAENNILLAQIKASNDTSVLKNIKTTNPAIQQAIDGRIAEIEFAKQEALNEELRKKEAEKEIAKQKEEEAKRKALEIEELKRQQQEELDNIGQKALQRRLQDLREAKSDKEISQAILNIEKNVKAGAKITKEEQEFVDKKKQELKDKGIDIITYNNKVYNNGLNLEVNNFKYIEDGDLLTEEEVIAVEKELENIKRRRKSLEEKGLSKEKIDNHFEDSIDLMTTVRPQLNKDGKMIQAAKVDILSIPINGIENLLEESKKNFKNKAQERINRINAKYKEKLDALENANKTPTNGPTDTNNENIDSDRDNEQPESNESNEATDKELEGKPTRGAKVISTAYNDTTGQYLDGDTLPGVSKEFIDYERNGLNKVGDEVTFSTGNINKDTVTSLEQLKSKEGTVQDKINTNTFNDIVDNYPIQINTIDKSTGKSVSSFIQGRPNTSDKDAIEIYEKSIRPLREKIIIGMLQGNKIEDLSTTISEQFPGVLKVDKQIQDPITGKNLTPQNNIFDLSIFKGLKDKIAKIDFFAKNSFYVDYFGTLRKTTNRQVSPSTSRHRGRGEIFFNIKRNNGTDYLLKLNVKYMAEEKANALYDLMAGLSKTGKTLANPIGVQAMSITDFFKTLDKETTDRLKNDLKSELTLISKLEKAGEIKNFDETGKATVKTLVDLLVFQDATNPKTKFHLDANGTLNLGLMGGNLSITSEQLQQGVHRDTVVEFLKQKKHNILVTRGGINYSFTSRDYIDYLLSNNILSTNAKVNQSPFGGYSNIYLNHDVKAKGQPIVKQQTTTTAPVIDTVSSLQIKLRDELQKLEDEKNEIENYLVHRFEQSHSLSKSNKQGILAFTQNFDAYQASNEPQVRELGNKMKTYYDYERNKKSLETSYTEKIEKAKNEAKPTQTVVKTFKNIDNLDTLIKGTELFRKADSEEEHHQPDISHYYIGRVEVIKKENGEVKAILVNGNWYDAKRLYSYYTSHKVKPDLSGLNIDTSAIATAQKPLDRDALRQSLPDSISNIRSRPNALKTILDYFADTFGFPKYTGDINSGDYIGWLQTANSAGYAVANLLNSPKRAFDLITEEGKNVNRDPNQHKPPQSSLIDYNKWKIEEIAPGYVALQDEKGVEIESFTSEAEANARLTQLRGSSVKPSTAIKQVEVVTKETIERDKKQALINNRSSKSALTAKGEVFYTDKGEKVFFVKSNRDKYNRGTDTFNIDGKLRDIDYKRTSHSSYESDIVTARNIRNPKEIEAEYAAKLAALESKTPIKEDVVITTDNDIDNLRDKFSKLDTVSQTKSLFTLGKYLGQSMANIAKEMNTKTTTEVFTDLLVEANKQSKINEILKDNKICGI